jgi:hypothetical protein
LSAGRGTDLLAERLCRDRRDIFLCFDTDRKVRAPVDAWRLMELLGIASLVEGTGCTLQR